MFDIEGEHVAQLNDTDLRTLVARLCEAELGRAGSSVSGFCLLGFYGIFAGGDPAISS